jgi:hypothetical protein
MTDTCPGDKFREGAVVPSACELIKEEVIRQKVHDFLLGKKGYVAEDIAEEVPFYLKTDREVFRLKVSMVVQIKGRPLVLIKCGAGSILARERPTLALARLFGEYQVPLTIVTNGDEASILNTLTGETLGCGLEAIPDKKHLLSQLADLKTIPLPEKRVKLEKQILSAFEALGLHGECH